MPTSCTCLDHMPRADKLASSFRGRFPPHVPGVNGLLAEESPLELPGLGGRQRRLLEQLHNLIRELPLLWRERRRRCVPVQTSANVRVDARARVCELVSELVQLAHLLEQRLELRVVDRHDRTEGTSLNEPNAPAPLVLTQQHAAELGESFGRVVEGANDALAVLDRQRENHRVHVQRMLALGSSTISASSRTSSELTGRPASIIEAIICSPGRVMDGRVFEWSGEADRRPGRPSGVHLPPQIGGSPDEGGGPATLLAPVARFTG